MYVLYVCGVPPYYDIRLLKGNTLIYLQYNIQGVLKIIHSIIAT